MFRCNDGLCLDSKRRCDGRPHCLDGSDEINCRTVVIFLYLSVSLSPFLCRSKPIRVADWTISMEHRSNGIDSLIDRRYSWIYGRFHGSLPGVADKVQLEAFFVSKVKVALRFRGGLGATGPARPCPIFRSTASIVCADELPLFFLLFCELTSRVRGQREIRIKKLRPPQVIQLNN